MCGVAGGVSFRGAFVPPLDALEAFAAPLRHRGPDAEGSFCERFGDTAVVFAHKRLAIIDLSRLGNQPMRSPSGESVIVFNGEIYNHRELREELAGTGSHFRSRSDTEVLLAAFERWGMAGLLDRIDGMFAFALYHAPSETLYLARDPFGKKPCYYRHDADRQALTFSSDIRSFAVLDRPLSIDLHALGYFFCELTTPEQHCIWREVKKVPPGALLTVTRDGVSVRQYWNLRYGDGPRRRREEIVETTEALLRQAVRKRLVADVRVSALLSGGVDSSTVVALMAQEASAPVTTYSVGFAESDYNELPYARAVAARYATDHHEFVMEAGDIVAAEALVHEYGEPFADNSMIPTYLIAKAVSRNEKVVLGGDGGDEMFAGYYVYYFAHKLELVKRLAALRPIARWLERAWPSYRTRFLHELLAAASRPRCALLDRQMGFSREDLGALFGPLPEIVGALSREHARVWHEFAEPYSHTLVQTLAASLHTRLVNDYLPKVDRASMYASVEMRSPFLDKDLARFAAGLPPAEILKYGVSKSILKDVARRHVPSEVVDRPKKGFAVPVGEWFRGALTRRLRAVILEGRQSLVPIDYRWVERLIERHQNGEDHAHRLWILYVFHVWAQGLGQPRRVPPPWNSQSSTGGQ